MKGPSQRLELRQSQTLIMTPQLQQAIKMLQLSNLELTDFINGEIQQNPLLERREPLREDAFGDYDNDAQRASAAAAPDTLSGEFAPDVAEHGNPNGEGMATGRSILAASRSCGAITTAASMRRPVPGSTRPQPGCAPCASICSSRSGPTLATKAIELSRCTFSICLTRMAIFAPVSTGWPAFSVAVYHVSRVSWHASSNLIRPASLLAT